MELKAPNPNGYLPPQALELEASVLGAAMMQTQALRTMVSLLTTEEVFYNDANRYVYRIIRELSQRGSSVDMLTVIQGLKAASLLERVGGHSYVAELAANAKSAVGMESHCRILQQKHIRRAIITTGNSLQQKGYDEGRDELELLASSQADLTRLHHSLESRTVDSADALYDEVFADMEHAVGQRGMTGVPTGLTELNDATGGWQPGDLIILAARPAMGKTAVMLHEARVAALDSNIATAIFSLEMPKKQLIQRMIASEVSGYSNSDLRRGNLPGGVDEVRLIAQKAARLKSRKLLIDDTPGLSIFQLRAKVSRLVAEYGVGLVMVDYIQLMRGELKGNREQEIGSITRGLKEMAKEHNIPVIALAQLSRDVEKRGGEKRPMLSDLRESGSIEQDADVILFLWRGEYYKITEYADGTPTADTILLDIAKHRNGSTGEVIAGCSMRRGLLADLHPPLAGAGEYAALRPLTTVSNFDEPAPF